ncbi:MAG TPA: hypothetical protein VHV10_20125 [Ktedonobacteraceae bacterium]|jgi:hypothetical protein|nr:hypothetical protein [Ktedonobacteraceae bacterium]
MYCTKIDIFRCPKYPLVLGAIYEKIAEHPRLPDLRTIQKSAKEDVTWPDRSYNRLEVYYLDNLVEANRRELFQLRFSTAPNSRELTSLFLSIEESQVVSISIQFPGKTGQMAASHVIGAIKSTVHELKISPDDLYLEVQAFPEQGSASYISEHRLSAFVWINGLDRYLHVREDPQGVRMVRTGKIKL